MSQFILNLHGVGPVPRDLDDGERDCWLDRDFFEAVLELAQGGPHVRLTFDDGNSSDCELVLPALLRRGLQATFFVCSGRLDQPTFLNRVQVRELQSGGMQIGSHGAAHIPWRHLPPVRLREEIIDSRRILENACGGAVDTAACPFGAYDRRVLRGLRRAGYRFVYTSDGGASAGGSWLQPRTTVTRSMTLPAVQRLVHEGLGIREQWAINVRRLLKGLR
jgi:peptidoglycan/xylan/chitin deacetylase (PgdA/CDA1 family)